MSHTQRAGPRVLVVTASASRRGAEIQGSQLAEGLLGMGLPVRVRALHPGSGAALVNVPVLGGRPRSLATLRALRRAARSAEVVVAYGSHTLPACAAALSGTGVPFVYRSIGDPEHWAAMSQHPRLTGLAYRRAAAVVALWPGAAEAIQRLHGVPVARLSVIPNARRESDFPQVTEFERLESRRALGIGPEPVALFIGSLSPEKRVDRAIEALALTRSHRLLIAGEGADRSRAEELSRSLAPGRVTFLGHVPDIRRVLAASDVLIISSETEGMPGAAIEALLTGIPVVATPVGALTEMAGVSLASPSPQAMADAIESVQRPPTPRDYALPFTWQRVLPQWVRILRRVTGVEVRIQPAAEPG